MEIQFFSKIFNCLIKKRKIMKEVLELFSWILKEKFQTWEVFRSKNGVVSVKIYCRTQDECVKAVQGGFKFFRFDECEGYVVLTKYLQK